MKFELIRSLEELTESIEGSLILSSSLEYWNDEIDDVTDNLGEISLNDWEEVISTYKIMDDYDSFIGIISFYTLKKGILQRPFIQIDKIDIFTQYMGYGYEAKVYKKLFKKYPKAKFINYIMSQDEININTYMVKSLLDIGFKKKKLKTAGMFNYKFCLYRNDIM